MQGRQVRLIAGPIRMINAEEGTMMWGYKGENRATEIEICVTEMKTLWEGGVPTISFRRADGREYAHEVDYMENWEYAYVPLIAQDTEKAGACAVTLNWMWNGRVAKTETYHGMILESVNGQSDAPGADVTLLEQMNAAAARAEAAAIRAEAAALEAQKAAGNIYETT